MTVRSYKGGGKRRREKKNIEKGGGMIDIDSKATWLEKKMYRDALSLFFVLFFSRCINGNRNTKFGGGIS